MKKYFTYFRLYKSALILAPLLVVIDVICEIVQPELMSKIVDVGVRNNDLSYIFHTGGIMIGLSLIAIGANIGNIYYSSHASVGFATALRTGMFHKIQQFSFTNLDKLTSSSLVTRITNDVNILQDVIMMSLRLLIRAPLMLLFAVVIAVRINAGLASVIAVAIPVLAVSIYIILRRGFPFFEKVQRKLDKVNAVVQENLIGVRVVKSFVRENFETKKFGHTNDELREAAVQASGTVVLIMPVMQLVMNISIVAIIWFGGNKIVAGTFQVGQLMSFITYITQILMSLMMLSMTIMTVSRAGASSERILDVLNTHSDIHDSPRAKQSAIQVQRGKIEFRDVSFKYHPEGVAYVLKELNFKVNAGETVAIVGSTGSAKSTLIQLIPRLYDVTKGTIYVDDTDVRDYSLKNLRKGICLVLQKDDLFSGTIKQNIKWGDPDASDDEVVVAAKDAQAHDFIMSFPLQYETVLGQGGVNISGGQNQRICLARAILRKPAVIILDDSTSAVDVATESRIRQSFRQHLKTTTAIIVGERISSILTADKIIILDEGAIAGMGTHAELLQTNRIYQEIYNSQQLHNDNEL